MTAFWRRNALAAAATFAGFFAIALCSLLFTKIFGRVAAVWPANAFLLVMLLKARPESRLTQAAAAWLANVAADLVTGDRLISAMVLSSLNVAEAGASVLALQRSVRSALDLSVPKHLLSFIAVALIVPVATAAAASLFLLSEGIGTSAETFVDWWIADALGLLIFAPAAMILLQGAGRDLVAPEMIKRTLLNAGLLAVGLSITFLQARFPFLFLVPPILVLVTFQLGLAGAAWAMLVTALFSMIALFNGLGPTTLVSYDVGTRVHVLQLFLAFMVVTTLPLSAVLTNRRRLERDLQAERDASKELANSLAEARTISQMAEHMAGVSYWVHRPDTGETVWSKQMYTHYGLEDDGRVPDFSSLLERFHIDDRADVEKFALRSLRTGEEYSLELRLTYGETIKWVMVRTRRETLPGGSVALLGTMVDVSATHQAADALVESEARYRLLADTTSDVVLKVDLDQTIQYISPSVLRYGYRPEDLVGLNGMALVHPDDVPNLRQVIGSVLSGGQLDPALDNSYRLATADGQYVWFENNPALVRDAAGAPIAVISQLRDISERRAATAALAESEFRHRLVAESATDIVSRMGLDGRVKYFSPSVTEITGYAVAEVTGASMIPLLHPDDIEATLSAYRDLIAGKQLGKRLSYRIRHKDGRWIWLEGSPTLVHDATGAPSEIIDIRRDVTAKVLLEAELHEARRVAERAAQTKADFMSNMSHELRTPLTSIIGFAGLLKLSSGLDNKQNMFAERIDKSGKTLLRLVNDILDFSKIEADGVVLEAVDVDLRDVTDEALTLVSAQADAKGLDMKVDLGTSPASFLGDAVRLRQVLVNLLGNAVKFTDQGHVELTVRKTGKGMLRFAVTDTGAGIAPDRAAEIFDRYTQADGSTTRTHGGTGLGLAICKGLVEAMGGEIGVESAPGSGSTFWFTIRVPAVSRTARVRAVA